VAAHQAGESTGPAEKYQAAQSAPGFLFLTYYYR